MQLQPEAGIFSTNLTRVPEPEEVAFTCSGLHGVFWAVSAPTQLDLEPLYKQKQNYQVISVSTVCLYNAEATVGKRIILFWKLGGDGPFCKEICISY